MPLCILPCRIFPPISYDPQSKDPKEQAASLDDLDLLWPLLEKDLRGSWEREALAAQATKPARHGQELTEDPCAREKGSSSTETQMPQDPFVDALAGIRSTLLSNQAEVFALLNPFGVLESLTVQDKGPRWVDDGNGLLPPVLTQRVHALCLSRYTSKAWTPGAITNALVTVARHRRAERLVADATSFAFTQFRASFEHLGWPCKKIGSCRKRQLAGSTGPSRKNSVNRISYRALDAVLGSPSLPPHFTKGPCDSTQTLVDRLFAFHWCHKKERRVDSAPSRKRERDPQLPSNDEPPQKRRRLEKLSNNAQATFDTEPELPPLELLGSNPWPRAAHWTRVSHAVRKALQKKHDKTLGTPPAN